MKFYIRDSKPTRQEYRIVFHCIFNRCNNNDINDSPKCRSILIFKILYGYVTFLSEESNFVHNHEIDGDHLSICTNVLTSTDKRDIAHYRSIGLDPGNVRIRIRKNLSKDEMYNAARKALKERFSDQLNNALEEMFQQKDFHQITYWKNDFFKGFSMISKIISQMPYASDIVEVDDTECTNTFDLPLYAAIVFDENNNVQILGFGILADKSIDSFTRFFQFLHKYVGNIRVTIVDRHKAQSAAIRKVYPNCKVVFCKIHIKRNIKQNFGGKSEILNMFCKLVDTKSITTKE